MKLPRPTSGYMSWHTVRFVLFLGAIATLLLYRLSALTNGALAPSEITLKPAPDVFHNLQLNPLFLPMQLMRMALWYISHGGTIITRLPDVIAGCALVLSFTTLVRMWYGSRSALFGFILLVCAPWFLHLSRLGLNDILFPLSLTIMLLFYTAWQRSDSRRWFWLAPIVNSILLYTPGLIWFILIGVIWQGSDYLSEWRNTKLIFRAIWLILWPLVAGLLVAAFIHSPHLLYAWIGLPSHFGTPHTILHNIASILLHIFIRGPQPPLIGLGFLPLVNTFTLAMAIIGGYFYVSHWRASRSRTLLAITVFAIVLIGIGGPVNSSILLPLIYILAAGGIGYLLREWLKVFPRNPLAKALGYGLISLVLAFATAYNLRQYFVAWPHNITTRAIFGRQS